LGNTFILNNIIVLNSLGDVVPGAYAVGDSGITYANAAIPAAVPEPSTVLLLGTGIGLVATLRNRRKKMLARG
jgi:hypothetical protein